MRGMLATVVAAAVRGLLGGPRTTANREPARPRSFASAGMTILSTDAGGGSEIWCRCDGGPLGFLSIAAHGHADALSVEVRYDGVELLVDPGTYCYHGEPQWRSYFRSTRAHNTLELDQTSQAREGGPFMWSTAVPVDPVVQHGLDADTSTWTARHMGYQRLAGSPVHERTVRLEKLARRLVIEDRVHSGTGHEVRLHFHLGPAVAVALDGARAELTWTGRDDEAGRALLSLPRGLHWSSHRGETDPVIGWFSPRFGVRQPTTTLTGVAPFSDDSLVTTLDFAVLGRN